MCLTKVDVVVIDAGGAAICIKLVSAFETSDAITGIERDGLDYIWLLRYRN